MDDRQLLHEFLDRGSRHAFEQFVARHIDMVYAAALRDVRDPHLADDITQAVFVLFLRKARHLGDRVVLGGWLFRAARFCARDALKRQRRQIRRERRIAAMNANVDCSNEVESIWQAAAPMLNDAIASLARRDRDAVVLRYLQQNSIADVAERLGVSPDAARQRLSRAVARLRDFFHRQGLAASSATLAIILETQVFHSAPAYLTAVAPQAALAGAQGALPASSAVASIAKGAADMMTFIKIKIATTTLAATTTVAITAGVLIAGTNDAKPTAPVPLQVAQATPLSTPASQPAAVPQPAKIDLSTPMATLRTNKKALGEGDASTLKKCYYTVDPAEQKAIDTIMDEWAFMAEFRRACAAKFGEAAAGLADPRFNLNIPDSAREEIKGDQAMLYNIGGAKPHALQRINGDWRFSYASLVENNFRDLPPLTPQKLTQVFESGVSMYKSLIEEVNGGKYPRIEEAMQALNSAQQKRGAEIKRIIGP